MGDVKYQADWSFMNNRYVEKCNKELIWVNYLLFASY